MLCDKIFSSLVLSHSEKCGNRCSKFRYLYFHCSSCTHHHHTVTAFVEVSFLHKTPPRVSCLEPSICPYMAAFLCCFKSDNAVIFCISYGIISQSPLWSTRTMWSPVTFCEGEESVSISRCSRNSTLCKHKNCLQYMGVFQNWHVSIRQIFYLHNFMVNGSAPTDRHFKIPLYTAKIFNSLQRLFN